MDNLSGFANEWLKGTETMMNTLKDKLKEIEKAADEETKGKYKEDFDKLSALTTKAEKEITELRNRI